MLAFYKHGWYDLSKFLLEADAMNTMSSAAQFYFYHYYFFTCKK